jgi:hypothetical protein
MFAAGSELAPAPRGLHAFNAVQPYKFPPGGALVRK